MTLVTPPLYSSSLTPLSPLTLSLREIFTCRSLFSVSGFHRLPDSNPMSRYFFERVFSFLVNASGVGGLCWLLSSSCSAEGEPAQVPPCL